MAQMKLSTENKLMDLKNRLVVAKGDGNDQRLAVTDELCQKSKG